MRGARRIEGGERKVERGAQARFAVVAGAMAQQIGPPVVPVGGQAFEVGFALRIGGKQLDRQRMAVERAEEAGQGGVGGEMIAGVAQEQGARIGVLKLFDVSQRARAGARKFWRLAANGDDEPEAVDGGEPAQKRLSRGCVLAPGRLQIVEDRQRRLDRRRRRRSWPPLRKPRPMPEGRDRSQAGSRRLRRSALARD